MRALIAALALFAAAPAQADVTTHALAMHGEPKYGPDFQHFDYVNPDAPKGGDVRYVAIGTFDSLNGFILKGIPATGLGQIYDSLTTGSGDEAFTRYGLIAESITVPDDRSWVAFTLRENARWHDGKPITVDDVIFTLDALKTKGHPFYRSYFGSVAKAEQTGPRTVKFTFEGGENRELPLIVGEMAILPKHYWEDRDFTKTTLEPPLGSGAYKVAAVEPGRSITYERVDDYWAKELPVKRGQQNFDSVRYDYYRDGTVALEAFKAGEYDVRLENVSKNWATAYDIPAIEQGLIKKEDIRNENPTGMQAFVFNTRRDIFKDKRVRQALAYAFDFEWTNRTLFYGQYTRTASYYSNSEMASSGLPSAAELEILEPLRGQIPEEVFTTEYIPPATNGSGRIRANLRAAAKLLKSAGWAVKDGVLTHGESGEAFTFEILLVQPTWERIALPFKKNLKILGIDASVRTVDAAQYTKRTETFDFDMLVDVFGQSLSPGNEQRDFWGSEAAAQEGGRNTIGVSDPAIDTLVELVISAPDRESLINRTRALDRVLLWNHLVIPHWHIQAWRVAYWNRFARPEVIAKYDLCIECWWIDPARDTALKAARNQ